MKTNYFTKVENKYVFNVSLIFWHIIIALASLVIVISLLGFLWGAIPPSHQKVVKQLYPEKKAYPAAVKVNLSELNLSDIKKEIIPDIKQEVVVIKEQIKPKPAEDLTGIDEYEAYMDSLKILIPPTKYSWNSVGYWYYPEGERYWKVYKQEKYRVWVIQENGLEEKINISFKKAGAKNYLNKKQMLKGYIYIVKLLPEIKRLNALQYLMENIADNVTQNINIYNSLSKVINKINNFENISFINSLTNFGKFNTNEGIPFIDYISTIISKFDKTQQSNIIANLVSSYYNSFNQNLSKQIEATNLYLPLVEKIKPEQQAKTIFQYYRWVLKIVFFDFYLEKISRTLQPIFLNRY